MELKVLSKNEVATGVWEMTLGGDFSYETVQPGQFIHVQVGDGITHVLRRPISIADVSVSAGNLTILFRMAGRGTRWLSQARIGDNLSVMGPLGRGFPMTQAKTALLVGGGIGIPPLYLLARRLAEQGKAVTTLLGWASAEDRFWLPAFERLGHVEISTEDGSLGMRGTAVDALAVLENLPDTIYACGPRPMLAALKRWALRHGKRGWFSMEERMACGVGACGGCVCRTEGGMETVCSDGPVFALDEVML